MQNERERLVEEVEAKKAEIHEKWNVLEGDLKHTVDSIKQVKEKVKNVTKYLNLKQQVQDHPLEVVGGVTLGGFLVGVAATRASASTGSYAPVRAQLPRIPKPESPTMRFFKDLLADEWKVAKGILLTEIAMKLDGVVKNKSNAWAQPINDVIQKTAEKMGAQKQTVRSGPPPYERPEDKQWRPGHETQANK